LEGSATKVSQIYYDIGDGFSEEHSVSVQADEVLRCFTLKFSLDSAVTFKSLRWDPLKYTACRVRIERISHAGNGRLVEFDRHMAVHNGKDVGDGWIEFLTLQPIYIFGNLSGNGGILSIEGQWEVIHPYEFNAYILSLAAGQTRRAVPSQMGPSFEILAHTLKRAAAYRRKHGTRAFLRRAWSKLVVFD
jgi:hypothetical protein